MTELELFLAIYAAAMTVVGAILACWPRREIVLTEPPRDRKGRFTKQNRKAA